MAVKSNWSDQHTLGSLRNQYVLQYEAHSTSMFEKSPMYAGKRLFNHLPLRIRRLDLKNFKKQIKELLASNPVYSIQEYFELKL